MIDSYYGYSLEGTMTASDEPLDAEGYTAARSTLPLGTRLLVGYRGESVWVTTNDHGSSVAGYDIDLFRAATRDIDLIGPGTTPVWVTAL